MNACRDISKVHTAKLISLALQREFNEILVNFQQLQQARKDEGEEEMDEDEFFEHEEYCQFKELAKKFQQFIYGTTLNELNKSREALIEFHFESINYCNDAHNIYSVRFFDLLHEFSSKLNNSDKKQILAHLNKQPISKKANKNEPLWESYFDYRDSLIALSNEAAQAVAAAAAITTTTNDQAIVQKKTSKLKTNTVTSTVTTEAHNEPALSSTVLHPSKSTLRRKINLSEISSIDHGPQEQTAQIEVTTNTKVLVGSDSTRKRSRTSSDNSEFDHEFDNSAAVDSSIKAFDVTLTSIGKENENVKTPKRSRITRSSVSTASKVSEPNNSFISAI